MADRITDDRLATLSAMLDAPVALYNHTNGTEVAALLSALAAEKEAHAETKRKLERYSTSTIYVEIGKRLNAESALAAALADRDRLAEALRALKGAWEQVQEAWDAACAALATPQAPTEP